MWIAQFTSFLTKLGLLKETPPICEQKYYFFDFMWDINFIVDFYRKCTAKIYLFHHNLKEKINNFTSSKSNL